MVAPTSAVDVTAAPAEGAAPPARWSAALRSATYVALMAGGAGLGFAKLLLLARLLSKEGFGQYVYLAALIQYGAPIAGLGILDGLARHLPMLIGQGRLAEADRLRDRCLGALAAVAAVGGALLLVACGVLAAVAGARAAAATLLVGVEILAFLWFSFGLRDLRSRLRARSFAALGATRASLDICMALVVAPRFGALGVLVAEIVVLSSLGLLISRRLLPGTRVELGGRAEVVTIVRDGALIVLGGVAANTALMGDRLVLGSILPKATYAAYAAHVVVVSAALIVSNIVVQYIYPLILASYGRLRDPSAVARTVARYGGALGALALCALPLVPWVSRFAGTRLLPGYAVDQRLLLLLFIGGAIEVANQFPTGLLVIGALRAFIVVQAIAGAAVVAALAVAARHVTTFLPFGAIFIGGRAIVLVGSVAVLWHAVRRSRSALDVPGDDAGAGRGADASDAAADAAGAGAGSR